MRQGQSLAQLRHLGMPWGYQDCITVGLLQLAYSEDLRKMIRQTLKKETDGVYFNVVVATHYLNNIRVRPGALAFAAPITVYPR